MKDKRRIINMLRNADEMTLERLTSEYPQAEPNHKDEMYNKLKERMSGSDNMITCEVRESERRSLWKMVPAAVLSIALVGGVIGGGMTALKNNIGTVPLAEIPEDMNASVTESDGAAGETDAVQEDAQVEVTKEQLFSKIADCRPENFDRLSYSYNMRTEYETGCYDENIGKINIDSTQKVASGTDSSTYFRADGSVVSKGDGITYICNGKDAEIGAHDIFDDGDIFNKRKMLSVKDTDSLDYEFSIRTELGKRLFENFDNWNITGTEEYLGRKCAVISGVSVIPVNIEYHPELGEQNDLVTCEYTVTIDTETGVWMKSDIKHSDYDNGRYIFKITGIGYGENAESPVSKDEFRQSALDNCFKCVFDEEGKGLPPFEPVDESDLDFLN